MTTWLFSTNLPFAFAVFSRLGVLMAVTLSKAAHRQQQSRQHGKHSCFHDKKYILLII
jgi:hypothetical protein